MVFYIGKPWRKNRNLPEVAQWLKQSPDRAGVFLLREWRLDPKKQLSSLQQGKGFCSNLDNDYTATVRQYIDDASFNTHVVRGLNIARSSWVELLLCEPKAASR